MALKRPEVDALKSVERLALVLVGLAVAALWAVYIAFHTATPSLPDNWDYKDVVSLLLAVVTVALTVLGIIIALAALWGYQQITQAAANRAAQASDIYFESTTFIARLDLLISERMKNARKDEIEPSLDVSNDGAPKDGGADEVWTDQ